MRKKLALILFVLILAALACGELEVGIEVAPSNQENPQASQPTATDSQPTVTPVQEAVREETEPPSDFSRYWIEAEDYRTGVRFAMPCFWVPDIPDPEQDPSGLATFPISNFTDDFVQSLGAKQAEMIWEIGGMKVDLGYTSPAALGLARRASLEEIAYRMVNPDAEHGIESTAVIEIQGRQALQVNTWSQFGQGRFYLIPAYSDLVVQVSPFPAEAVDHPDIQGVLHSFAMDDQQQMAFPSHMPAGPPEGMVVECMSQGPSGATSAVGVKKNSFQGTLDCAAVTEDDALMWVVCNVQDMLRSRNTQAGPGYMGETFKMGYWQSEGVEMLIDQAVQEIEMNLLPPNTGEMVFTTDESLFPPLFGMLAETMFGPDANIAEVIYSEGWGANGEGAALLYIAENPNGDYYFYGMVVAQEHFDK